MKKSISIFAFALIAISNTVIASNTDSSTVGPQNLISVDSASRKFVSVADASLIEIELGSLKKAAPSVHDRITIDLNVTEAVIPDSALVIRKEEKKCTALELKKKIRN